MNGHQFESFMEEFRQKLTSEPQERGVFALTPGLTNVTNYIGYFNPTGRKLRKEATEPPYKTFYVIAAEVNQFNEKMDERETQSGWKVINSKITAILNTTGHKVDPIYNYGQLTMEEIDAHSNTYVTSKSRQAQKIIQTDQ